MERHIPIANRRAHKCVEGIGRRRAAPCPSSVLTRAVRCDDLTVAFKEAENGLNVMVDRTQKGLARGRGQRLLERQTESHAVVFVVRHNKQGFDIMTVMSLYPPGSS